jgi:hypothetical protein
MVALAVAAEPPFLCALRDKHELLAMTLPEIAAALERLGCPSEKSAAMASQLDRRARMDAERSGTPYEAALAHLIGLMAQGWATQGPKPTE